MRGVSVVLLFAFLLLTQPGCATVRRWLKRERKVDRATLAMSRRPLTRVGMVALVNEADGFVLIDSGANPTPMTGARLFSYTGATPSAQLKASVVRRRPFVVADILDGKPRPGDEIYEVSTGVAVPVKSDASVFRYASARGRAASALDQ